MSSLPIGPCIGLVPRTFAAVASVVSGQQVGRVEWVAAIVEGDAVVGARSEGVRWSETELDGLAAEVAGRAGWAGTACCLLPLVGVAKLSRCE